MPRTSAAALSVIAIGPGRLDPPPDIAAEAAKVWRHIVGAAPVGHFKPEDCDLLAAYCSAVAVERRIAGKMAKAKAPARLIVEHARIVRSVVLLAMRLRLGPRARHPTKTRPSGSGAAQMPSAYDSMTLPPATAADDDGDDDGNGDRRWSR
jgi:phage terminase small subunit